MYSDEDVAQLKRKAKLLVLLSKNDNVTGDQVDFLRALTQQQARRNKEVVPVMDTLESFLEHVTSCHQQELSEARKEREAAEQKHGTLSERLRQYSDPDAQKNPDVMRKKIERMKEDLSRLKNSQVGLAAEEQEVQKQIRAHSVNSARLEREMGDDVSNLVEQNEDIRLQTQQLEELEKEYLRCEQLIYRLQSEQKMLEKGNAELMLLCEELMQKVEAATVAGGQ